MHVYSPMLFVAECGSNHCGSLDRAVELVHTAKAFGAGAVKFQLFKAEKMYQPGTRGYRQKVATLEPWEFRPGWLTPLSKLTRDLGMQFIMSVFHPDMVELLDGLVDQVKISAYDLPYRTLIVMASELKVPIILSTAMATADEITQALQWVSPTLDRTKITLLHGVAAYPAAWTDYDSSILFFLQSTGCRIGLSDHTAGITLSSFAAFPITIVEKHFRQFTTPPNSPDFGVSTDPLAFKTYVHAFQYTRERAEKRLSEGPLPSESPLYKTCRRTDAHPYRS